MDPEVIAQIEEQLRQMNELLAQQNSMMASQLGAMKGAAGKLNTAYGSFGSNINSATQATNKYVEAQQKALDQANASVEKWGNVVKTTEKAISGFNGALSGVSGIIGSFGGALLSAEKGFSKYGSTVDSAANATQSLASSIPIIGQALGGVVGVLGKVISRVVGDALKLTDTIVSLRDETVKTTGVLPTTTEGMLQLANNAKYFGENIQVLAKITQGLGNNLVGLGDTAGRGATKFMEMADVTEETRQRFGKMGISQEELTKLQGEYVKSQVSSGLAYTMQNKTMEQLRKESLKYAENMTTLSGLTGKQAESLQAEQDAARAVMQEKVAQRQDLIELQNLRKQGRTEEAAALESRMKEKAEFRDRLVALVGPEQAAQVMRVVRTGVYDNISGPLATLGINFQEVGEQLNNGAKGIDAANSMADKLSTAYDNRLTSLGNAAPLLDEETFKQIGINADTMGRQNVYFGKTIEEREKILKEDQAKREKGSPMDDAIEKARSFERQVQQQYQNFLIDGIKKAAALLKSTDLTKLAADALKYGMIAVKVGLAGLGVVTGILIAAKYKEWRASVDAKEAQRQFTKALQESTVAMRNQASASRAATAADKSEASASKSAASADKVEAGASRKAAQADLKEASASMRAASADLKEASASMKAASADLAEARASMKAAQADAMEGMGGGLGGGLGGKGGKGLFGKLGKGLKGGIAGILGGLVLDTASEYAMESGHEKLGAGLDVGSSALSGAGTGAMIGSVIPGVGTVVGGAVGGVLGGLYGLWQNKDTLFGDGKTESPEEQVTPDLSSEESLAAANEAAIQQQLAILNSVSTPGNGQGNVAPLRPEQLAALGLQAPNTDTTEDLAESMEDAAQTNQQKTLAMIDDQQSSVNSLIGTNSQYANSIESTTKSLRVFKELLNSLNMILGGVDENGNTATPAGGVAPTGMGMQFGGDTDRILSTIRQMESGNNYTAQNPTSSASGAYQFIDSTWQSLTKKYGIGTEFKSAKDAPAAIQDQIAAKYLEEVLKQANGDVSKVPVAWFTGNVSGKSSAVSQEQVAAYQSKWLGIYNNQPAGTQMAGMMPGMMPSMGTGGSLISNAGGLRDMLAMQMYGMGMPGMGTPGGFGGNQSAALMLARGLLGASEKGDTQTIMQYLKMGGMGINPALEAWCAAFVNSSLQQVGIRGTGSAVANSFQSWGTPVSPSQVRPGDVVLETRGKPPYATGGHVGLANGQFDGSKIGMIAGNTNNKVQEYNIPADSDVMVRRATGLPMAEKGGILKGPDDGYLAMLHGKEMVVPLDNKYTRSQKSESYTVNGKPASKREYDSFMKSHPELQNLQDKVKSMLTSMQDKNVDPTRLMQAASTLMDTNLTGIKDEIIDKNQRIQESITQMVATETSKAVKAVNDANLPMQNMSNEISRSMRKVLEAHTQSMNEMTYKLGEMIDALHTSNDHTKKILKKASA